MLYNIFMNRTFSCMVAFLLAVLTCIAGITAVSMLTSGEHSTMVSHDNIACMNSCLKSAFTDHTLPVVHQAAKLLLAPVTFILFYVMPIVLTLVFAIYAIKPRPSPDLVKLHAQYLD